MDRDLFNFDYPLKTWLGQAEANLKKSEEQLKYETLLLSTNNLEHNKLILNPFMKDLNMKNEIKMNLEQDYNELIARNLLLSTFITLSLELSRSNPIEGLSFYLNSFNYLVWLNFEIPKSRMENSAFSAMAISNVDLSRSVIIGTTFDATSFANCNFAISEITATNFTNLDVKDEINFSGAKFDDVFFQSSNLKYSNFKGAQGLKPIYFYKVKGLENVQFDDDFRNELKNEFITDEQFIEYIRNSKLIKLRADELINVLFAGSPINN